MGGERARDPARQRRVDEAARRHVDRHAQIHALPPPGGHLFDGRRQDADVDEDPVELEGLAHESDEAVGDAPAVLGASDVGEQDRELVAAESCGQVVGSQRVGEAVGDRLEQAVTGGMAQRVVDRFEVVEVEDDEPHVTPVALGLLEHVVESLAQERAIRQLGERVVHGAVGVAHGLAGAGVDRERRQCAQRHEPCAGLGEGDDDGRQDEHHAAGEELKGEIGA